MTSLYRGAGFLLGRQLRLVTIIAIIAANVVGAAAFWWAKDIFLFLLAPADGRLSPFGGLPVYSSPTGMFGATVGLAFMAGILCGALPVYVVGTLHALKTLLPYWLWKIAVRFVAQVAILFLCGVAFVYYALMPVSLNFFLGFGTEIATPVISLDEYMDMLLSLSLWLGLIFTWPVWAYYLSKLGLVTYQDVRKYRKYAPFVLTFFATIISPGLDGFVTFMVAIPMYLLYEVGLFTAWMARPGDGNFFWIKTIDRRTRTVRRRAVWIWTRPGAIADWIYEKLSSLFS